MVVDFEESTKKSYVCLQKFCISLDFTDFDLLIENDWKTLKYSEKGSSFFYMAGREVEIHRGRLDKKNLADRAQLFPRFLSKNIFKKFEKYRKHFHFFGWKFWKFSKNLDFFHLRRRKSRVIFEGSETKKVEVFRKFSNFPSKKIKLFFDIFQNF